MANLKELRMQAGLTQTGLARTVGMNKSQIQRYENGEHDIANMSLKNAVAIAAAIGVKPEALLGKGQS